MNTQTRVQRLEAGQVLQLASRASPPAVLAEGELLLQPAAQWLAGMVVVPPPLRFVAPSVLPQAEASRFVAVRACSVVLPATAPRLRLAALVENARRSLRLTVALARAWRAH
jgi:hypothetical protein